MLKIHFQYISRIFFLSIVVNITGYMIRFAIDVAILDMVDDQKHHSQNSSCSNSSNVHFSFSEIKEENGQWEIKAELKNKILSEGGEALVFSEKFGNFKKAGKD